MSAKVPAIAVPAVPAVTDAPVPLTVSVPLNTSPMIEDLPAENGLIAVGNMSDQSADGPDNVVTSVTWNMTPTVEYIIDQVAGGTYTSQDLKDFSMVAKGGAALAPIAEALVPDADLLEQVRAVREALLGPAAIPTIDADETSSFERPAENGYLEQAPFGEEERR